jgi:hypothetical protein
MQVYFLAQLHGQSWHVNDTCTHVPGGLRTRVGQQVSPHTITLHVAQRVRPQHSPTQRVSTRSLTASHKLLSSNYVEPLCRFGPQGRCNFLLTPTRHRPLLPPCFALFPSPLSTLLAGNIPSASLLAVLLFISSPPHSSPGQLSSKQAQCDGRQ